MTPTTIWQSITALLNLPATPCRGLLCRAPAAVGGAATLLYYLAVIVLSIYGFNAIVMTGLFLWHRRRVTSGEGQVTGNVDSSLATRHTPLDWPTVTVQLPVYNEMFVVERLIDAACALDYPAGRLTIQVLDDSTDGTTALARSRVAYHAAKGAPITLITRADRTGYKAGALAAGLASAEGELVALFDADFVPPPDFLRRLVPHFDEPDIGAVQARWGHLNADYNPITRAQALLLDGHFVVEQTARYRSGLFLNFNGSAGMWRRQCIDDAGGWQTDTIAEDMDLSYRAQLRGWRIRYLPGVVAPAEIPPQVMAHKRQQFRWAKGSVQCLLKNGGSLLKAKAPPLKRLEGLLHLSAYFVHPAMILLVLASLPAVLSGKVAALHLGALGLAGFGAPVMFAVAQWATYPKDWRRRFAYFIYIALLGSGLALNNTWAILEALAGRNTGFHRTPKFRVEGKGRARQSDVYALPPDWTTWGEVVLALYAALAAWIALSHAPGLAPFLWMHAGGFAYTAWTAVRQSERRYSPARMVSKKSSVPPVIR